MSLATDLKEISSTVNWLLVLYQSSDHSLKLIYESLPLILGNRIHLTTRYFNADIPFHLNTLARLPDLLKSPEFIHCLQTVPAVVIVSTTCDDISECQRAWNNIKNSVRDDATRALLLFEDPSDAENEELVKWAVLNEIEIISRDSCEGDSISQRFLELLACAPWQHQSHPVPSRTGDIAKAHTDAEELMRQAEYHRNLEVPGERKASEAMSSEEGEDRTLLNLSKATRIRRGLFEKDITSILNDMLLADSDSEDVE